MTALDGHIDEVALYKRVLTPGERTWLYNDGLSRTYADVMGGNPGTTGLASWWKLDETNGTRNDAYGTNHLADNNTVSYTTGKLSNAASFLSSNSEYLTIADNPSLSMGDVDFTVCTWANIASKSTDKPIVGKWDAPTNNREYFIYYNASTDRFSFVVSSDGIAGPSASVHGMCQ